MSEDLTKRFEGGSPFEKRVIAEFAALRGDIAEIRTQQAAMARNIASLDRRLTSVEQRLTSVEQRLTSVERHLTSLDQRLTSLEEKVDMRLKETRPIWEAVKAQIEKLDEKFNLFIRDLYDIRGEISLHGKRLDIIERRVLS